MRRSTRLDLSGCVAFIAVGLWMASGDMALSQQPPTSRAPRVVNVTADSEKGWVPSEEMERQALKTAADYLADEDGGRVSEAYARFAEINRQHQPFADFSANIRQRNAQLGAVIEHRITTVNWTKNPAQAPLPGVYAAIDLVSRYANVDRHCGYLVVYQPPSGGGFQIMREEINFMDNDTVKKSTPAEAERVWAKLSANCPNYRPAPVGPLSEASGAVIEYPNVAAALKSLHEKKGVIFRNENGWTVAEDSSSYTIWSFPPVGHPAYPSAVKRHVVQENVGSSIQMAVHCEASKQACDDLVRTFAELNERMTASVRGSKP